MRSFVAFMFVLLIAASPLAAQVPTNNPTGPNTLSEQASYGIGLSIGRDIKKNGAEIDLKNLVLGMRHGLKGQKPVLTDEELDTAMKAFHEAAQSHAKQRNTDQGKSFLAENKAKSGVTTLPSGLQYKVLKQGNGPTPKATDTVRTHYEGTLIDGTVFDSSYRRGEPAEFPVNGVIAGWTEALQLMKVGDKWQLFIPSELAYGARGAGGAIGPHAALVFQIELLGIK